MESDLFYQGVRPAINVGLSVSRVGSAAQTKAMKAVAGKIKLDLAQYREMAAFSQFASDLDASTQQLLAKGSRLVELLKQDQNAPLSVGEQVCLIYAGVRGFLESIDLSKIRSFQDFLLQYIKDFHSPLLDGINDHKTLPPELDKELQEIIKEALLKFNVSGH